MTDILGKVVRYIPQSVRYKLRGTVIHDVYGYVRGLSAGYERYEFSTPVGMIELEIPEGSTFGKSISDDTGGYEPVLINELDKELSEDSIYYNIGGRFGYTAVVAEKIGVSPENIHIFEANRFFVSVLNRNCDDDVQIIKGYVGEQTTDSQLAIDDYINTKGSKLLPDVVKIDVEGAECKVLKGMDQVMRKKKPIIYVEVHPHLLPDFQSSESDLISILSNKNYDLKVADHRTERSKFESLESNTPDDSPYLLKAQ